MNRYDVIVLGAGISGLSLAHQCAAAGLNTLVIEKSSRAGGCFHSHAFTGDADGFWLELGAHTCYNSYGSLLDILKEKNILDRLIGREKVPFRMLVGSEIKSIPSQLNFLELFASGWRVFTAKKEGKSVASYYAPIVGRSNYDRVFSPAFNAVISQRADEVPAEMLFKKRPRRPEVARSFTLQGGLQTITDSLTARQGITLKTNTVITAVTGTGAEYSLTAADGAIYTTSTVAFATPPTDAAALARNIDQELSAVLGKIGVETIETVGVAVPKDALRLEPLAGIIAADDVFYSAVSRDTVKHESFRGFSFHFKEGKLDLEAKLKRIAEVLGVSADKLQQVVTRENRLPSPVVGHSELVTAIDRALEGKRILVTGNYFAGMAIEDCVSRSCSEFARLRQIP